MGKRLLIGLVVLHVLAIVWYQLRKGQALVPAMVHGDKSLPQAAAASRDGPTPWTLAALLLMACALAVRWLIHLGGA